MIVVAKLSKTQAGSNKVNGLLANVDKMVGIMGAGFSNGFAPLIWPRSRTTATQVHKDIKAHNPKNKPVKK